MIINHPAITESENFHGFRTVHFYEAECARAGQTTRRIPGRMEDGTPAFALLTLCPTNNPASYDGLDILTADEAHCLYSGSIRHDANRELSFHSLGFTADDIMDCVNPAGIRERISIPDLDSDPFVRQVVADAKRTDQPEPTPTDHHQDDLVQLSLFSI